MTAIAFPQWARISAERRAHVESVARLLADWAEARRIDDDERGRWQRAAYLHDAVKDGTDEWLASVTDDHWGIPALAHGPAAAAMAQRDGERDEGVLLAVRYHSVGYASWDDVGRMLYLADYIDPERGLPIDTRGLAARVPADPNVVLREVAALRIGRLVASGGRLLPETVEFWNAII